MGTPKYFDSLSMSRTMTISRYGEAEGGEIKLEADESFFRY
ncbi:MAG: hypothetical protein NWF05_06805 [Candidatus Bathyarchaeota archaeon]|nr:hypothetical protein [Candidatus Bathyarchaeota archaeon]